MGKMFVGKVAQYRVVFLCISAKCFEKTSNQLLEFLLPVQFSEHQFSPSIVPQLKNKPLSQFLYFPTEAQDTTQSILKVPAPLKCFLLENVLR